MDSSNIVQDTAPKVPVPEAQPQSTPDQQLNTDSAEPAKKVADVPEPAPIVKPVNVPPSVEVVQSAKPENLVVPVAPNQASVQSTNESLVEATTNVQTEDAKAASEPTTTPAATATTSLPSVPVTAAATESTTAETNGTLTLKRPKPEPSTGNAAQSEGVEKDAGVNAPKKPKMDAPSPSVAPTTPGQSTVPAVPATSQGIHGIQSQAPNLMPPGGPQFMGQHGQPLMGANFRPPGQQQAAQGNTQAHQQQPAVPQPHIPQGGTPVLVQTPVPPGAEQQRQLKVEDAMNYLDQVKSQFGSQPQVYNHFLEIMKSFKSQAIDTPGVIDSVSELFRGHNNLILGFNTFLPPGFKIEINNDPSAQQTLQVTQPHNMLPQQQQQEQQHVLQQQHNAFLQGGSMPHPDYVNMAHGVPMGPNGANFHQGQGQNNALNRGGGHLLNMVQPNHMGQPGSAENMHGPGSNPAVNPMAGMGGNMPMNNFVPMAPAMMPGANVEESKQPLEFDHAINYVTKIKKRFQDDAETYKQFLDILHTYQKEQKSIKEVLDQVADLFKDHTDLLKEFLFFLPDSVREHAKEEIARLSKSRKKRLKRQNEKIAAKAKAREQEKEKALEDPLNRIPLMERKVFLRIKKVLGSRDRWGEFLKCLDLFAQDVISRSELITLLSDVFENNDGLLNEFDRLLAMRGATDNIQEDAWFSMPLQEVDFAQCRRCTPSYRALPATYPKPPCSERTALCRSVLNDTWVSMPTGSEDFSFMRRNQYEEVLYKVADEMYEVDLVIESNAAAIRRLTPLANEIEALKCKTGDDSATACWRFKLDRRTLSAIHLKAIARVYGEHGSEILELLRKNPAGAIPVILERLKQKDVEWRKNQMELNKSWKEQQEKNYYKSLDHQLDFKTNDKRRITPRQIMADIKERARTKASGTFIEDPNILMLSSSQQSAAVATAPVSSAEDLSESPEKLVGEIKNPDLVLEFPDVLIHRHCWALIALAAEVQMGKLEAERTSAFFKQFIHPLFKLPKSWLNTSNSLSAFEILKLPLHKQAGAAENQESVKPEDAFPPNTRVLTEYGVGSVVSFDALTGRYKVHLSFGEVFVQPNRIFLDEKLGSDTSSLPISTLDESAEGAGTGDVFFASTASLNFFRLYHLIYSRLKQVKEICDSGNMRSAKHSIRHYMDRDPSDLSTTTTSVTEARAREKKLNGSSPAESEKKSDSVVAIENPAGVTTLFGDNDHFDTVLALLNTLVDGSLESSKFEEDIRGMMGASGYFLSTMEKVVSAAIKQLVAVVSDDKLVECIHALDQYESARTGAGMSKVYKTTRSVLLQEGCCFRMQFVPGKIDSSATAPSGSSANPLQRKADAHSLPSEMRTPFTTAPSVSAWKSVPRLLVELVDQVPETLTVPPEAGASDNLVALRPSQVDFGLGTSDAAVTHKPFLVRSLRETAPESSVADNGLRMSLVLPLFRISYIPGSEDVFRCIQSHRENADGNDARESKYQKWYDAKISELGVVESEGDKADEVAPGSTNATEDEDMGNKADNVSGTGNPVAMEVEEQKPGVNTEVVAQNS